jgi:hypothetical protein
VNKEQLEFVGKLCGYCYDKPLEFVVLAYPWESDPALQVCKMPEKYRERFDGAVYGPDEWACRILDDLGECIKKNNFNGFNPVEAVRMAVASGHGIGKSALTAWLVNFILSTRPHSKGTVTANTLGQLETKTWAEIAKWTKKCITGEWFDVTTGKGSMKIVHKEHPSSWYCSAQTCKEENSESFAGQHAVDSTSFYIFDEASAVPDIISEVAEGGLTDGEPMFFKFGNPTRNIGDFFDCFNSKKHRWITYQIDSRDVQITNKKFLQEMIDDYGIDSDIVKVRIRGMFPSRSSNQFIPIDLLDEAFGRELRVSQYDFAPKIIGCDPAWGGEDELVIAMRQGLAFKILEVLQKNDNDFVVAQKIAAYETTENADAVFIDAGQGTGIYSAGKTMGRDWRLVWFAAKPSNPGYLNKRAEMYGSVKDWLQEGGALPDDKQLYNELMSILLVEERLDGKIQLLSKKEMKKLGINSQNRADALAITFAEPVYKKQLFDNSRNTNYDPFKKL